MKFSPTFLVLAVAMKTALAAPGVDPQTISDQSSSRLSPACIAANNEYTGVVVLLQKYIAEAKANWEGSMSDEQRDHFKRASDTVDELFTTTVHVDYENGSAVFPTLSQQQKMQSKLENLIKDIEGAKPSNIHCLGTCFEFGWASDAVTGRTGVRNSLDSLSKSCAGQSLPLTKAQPSGSSSTPIGSVSPKATPVGTKPVVTNPSKQTEGKANPKA